jgi:hypothetical protein
MIATSFLGSDLSYYFRNIYKNIYLYLNFQRKENNKKNMIKKNKVQAMQLKKDDGENQFHVSELKNSLLVDNRDG